MKKLLKVHILTCIILMCLEVIKILFYSLIVDFNAV